MAILKKSSAPSFHFYTKEGKSMHRMPLADGTGERPTHLGDAKKLGLYPSVSAILGLLSKSGLEKWKNKQVALASMRITRNGSETDDYFADRIIEEAFKQVDDAARLGTDIHREIERFFTWDWSKPFEPHPSLAVYVAPVVNWMIEKDIRVENPEQVVVNFEHGFAGTTDAPFRWKKGQGIGVIDFKSRKTKPGEPIVAYDGQAMQIAAYAASYWKEQNLRYCWGANIYISTTEPGRVDLIMYRPEMMCAEWECFKLLCGAWRHLNQWDPRVAPTAPQPVFYSGTPVSISAPVATSTPATPPMASGGPQVGVPGAIPPAAPVSAPPPPPPPAPPEASNVVKFPEGTTFLSLLEGARLDSGCDGIDFLDPRTCCEFNKPYKTIYAWYYHAETNCGRVGLKNDAGLGAHGWKNAFAAYPKHIDDIDKSEGKTPPVVGTNGLPPKPSTSSTNVSTPPPVKEKATKKKDKIADAARLVQLENYKVEFGKHKGEILREVDDSYLVWMSEQETVLNKWPVIREYLERPDVRKSLKLEAL
jgi:hypothetical protein